MALGLNYSAPLQTFITNFAYYSQKTKIDPFIQLPDIPDNGIPPLNPREYIYSLSAEELRLNFSYAIFLPNLNSSVIDFIYNCELNGKGCFFNLAPSFIVPYDFCGAGDSGKGIQEPLYYDANPLITTKNAASHNFHGYTIVIIATTLLLLYYSI